MKKGILVKWKHNPYIGIVMEDNYGLIMVHWLNDGYISWEDGRELIEVINENR